MVAHKPLYIAFVDIEKAFDRVPRKVLWAALRSVGVEEWAVRIIQGMHTKTRSRVGVDVHQGSALSPLLFILALQALSQEYELVYPGSYCTLMTSW